MDPTREPLPLALVHLLARWVVRTVFRVRLVGIEHIPATGPVIVAGNHSGFLDGPLVNILLRRPTIFLVKSEMYDSGFRRILDFARQIPVRRGTPDRTALRRALAVLDRGGMLAMFPEGTRGTGGLVSIQHGIGYIALRSDAPIVPVVCRGTAEALPKGRAMPTWRAPVDIVFGPAFSVAVDGDPRARATVAAAAEQVRAGLLAHLTAASATDVPGATGAPVRRTA